VRSGICSRLNLDKNRRMKNANLLSSLSLTVALALSTPVSTAGQAGLSSDANLNPPPPVAPASIARTDQGRATAFNQDVSGWCVSLITSEPTDFDTGATSWVLDRPVWGMWCPP